MIRAECAGCGMCCRTVWLPLSHKELEERSKGLGGDVQFAQENFYPLTAEEVLERNPHVATWVLQFPEHGKTEADFARMIGENFYGCRNHDAETGRCKIWADRPEICRNYPWYGGSPTKSHLFYAADCFYKRELPLELPPPNCS